MKCESQDLIKEINGLIGAVDGDTLKHLRRFIQKYNTLHWKYNRLKEKVQGLLDEIERKKGDVDASLSKILKGEKKDTAVNRGALYGWGEALFWVKDLIKKWFADVVEGEE